MQKRQAVDVRTLYIRHIIMFHVRANHIQLKYFSASTLFMYTMHTIQVRYIYIE